MSWHHEDHTSRIVTSTVAAMIAGVSTILPVVPQCVVQLPRSVLGEHDQTQSGGRHVTVLLVDMRILDDGETVMLSSQ